MTDTQISKTLSEISACLAQKESQFLLKKQTEKQIVWFDGISQTDWAIVYLHGFSASRTETNPLAALLAQQLKANVFYTRFAGHGLDGEALASASINQWDMDTQEAFELGRKLGKKILILACSTGATLAMEAACRLNAEEKNRFSFAFISPNFGLKDQSSFLLHSKLGRWIIKKTVGTTRYLQLANEAERICYTPNYPYTALLPVLKAIDRIKKNDMREFDSSIISFYSSKDKTVNHYKTITLFNRMTCLNKELVEIKDSSAINQHVLAGGMASPNTTDEVKGCILKFIEKTNK